MLTTINITPTTVNLDVNDDSARQLTATTLDQFGNAIAGAFTWKSSNPSVATVSTTGLVKAIAAGTTSITATSGAVVSAPSVVTVVAGSIATTIYISPPAATLMIGKDTQRFSATVWDQNNKQMLATPTWKSSNPAVATISWMGDVTPVSAGTTNITASSGSATSAPSIVTVVKLVLAKIDITPATTNLTVGGPMGQITASTLDQFGNPFPATVTWASSNKSIVLVNTSTGQIKAVGVGTANITATSGGVTSTPAVVKVLGGSVVTTIDITPATFSLNTNGATQQMTATTYDQYGNLLVANVAWTSSNAAVAKVSSTGVVTSGIAGTANITASNGNAKSNVSVVTVAPVVPVVGEYSFPYASNAYNSSRFVVSLAANGNYYVTFYPQNYTGYSMQIVDGKFHYQNGYVGGNSGDNSNQYPTDGFKIVGQFNNATSPSGVVNYVYNGKVQSTYNFTLSPL